MASETDRDYFAARADQENELGDRAATPAIAAIHYELAYHYALRASDLDSNVIPLLRKTA